MVEIYLAPHSESVTGELNSSIPTQSTEITATFNSDVRWKKIKVSQPSSSESFGKNGEIYNSAQVVQAKGFFLDGMGAKAPASTSVTAKFEDYQRLNSVRITASAVYLSTPTIKHDKPKEKYVLVEGFDGCTLGISAIRHLNFLVKPQGFLSEKIKPEIPTSNAITARFFDYESLPATRITGRTTYPNAATVDRYFAPATQHTSPFGERTTEFGQTVLKYDQFLKPGGLNQSTIGEATLYNTTQDASVSGFNAQGFGTAAIVNKSRQIFPGSFVSQQFGSAKIYNLRQYVKYNGLDSAKFGTPFLIGGVKYVSVIGLNALAMTAPKVINTTANQFIQIAGMQPPALPWPKVSPRFIAPQGILSFASGNPIVQRNPSPKGFSNDFYGTAWISHSPRFIAPGEVEGFVSGYPKAYDPTQKVLFAGQISGGIFGDIAIRNTRRLISPIGIDQSSLSDWTSLYSNLINIQLSGFDSLATGSVAIRNKTPSLIPGGLDTAAFGSHLIAERVRRLNVRGFGYQEQERFGRHQFSKSPELNPKAFDSMLIGAAVISNKRRYIFTVGRDNLAFGDARTWFRYRNLKPNGADQARYGAATITHGNRSLLHKGLDYAALGSPQIWFRVRYLVPANIYREFESNHQIGGTQHLAPAGFVATQFGSRIIPERQSLYPLGLSGQEFGLAQVELFKRWIRPLGFISFGSQASDRYGTAKVWNSRQYVYQVFDPNDGLNPGGFGYWTTINNRNRVIRVQSFDAQRFGYAHPENKARPILPLGQDQSLFGRNMIADRIRQVRPESIEAPHISTWANLRNKAAVIKAAAARHDAWGNATVVNNRREYRWVGAFDSFRSGTPMVAFKVRNLNIESRYSINPPYIPLPKFDLHTRYIEPIGFDLMRFGGPSLFIKWNIITPRWTLRHYFGDPAVRNVTPELRQRGNVTEEFGFPSLRRDRESYFIDGFKSDLFGRHSIGYLDRSITISGIDTMRVGLTKVTKTGAPPYSLQTITLDWVSKNDNDVQPDTYTADGIAPPERQVPGPLFKGNVIFPEGFSATRYGEHHAQSNGIILDSGIFDLYFGNSSVVLRNRTIKIPSLGDQSSVKGMPRLSPHTIYAVMEAPSQAVDNHPVHGERHYVKSFEVFGSPIITNKHRFARPNGFNGLTTGQPNIDLRLRYINVSSINAFRMGWHQLLDGSPQTIIQFNEKPMTSFGGAIVKAIYRGPQYVSVRGLDASVIGSSKVDFFHRKVYPVGEDVSRLGTKLDGDQAYKPKGLWVGEPMPTIPAGYDASLFGKTWISLRVRDVNAQGFDSFNGDMDISAFGGRLKVVLVKKAEVIEPKIIEIQSFNQAVYGVPDIRLKTHYIRPDGNSDQYRKGVPK